MRVVVIGCGRIARRHLEAIERIDSIDVVALVDSDEQKASELRESFSLDCEIYTDLEDCFDTCEVDLASICTPSGLHASHGCLAFERGCSVLVEKPMATRFSDALDLIKAQDKANKMGFIVKQNRFNPSITKLKDALGNGLLGNIKYVSINVFWSRPQDYYDLAPWRGTWEFDGGALMNQSAHYVDMADWLIGPVEQVACFGSTTRKIDVEDSAVAALRWRSGALGSLNITMLAPKKNREGSITVIGDQGIIKVGGIALERIEIWDLVSGREKSQLDPQSEPPDSDDVYGSGHLSVYLEVEKAMQGVPFVLPSLREGLRSLELIVAAYRSMRDNKIVGLPLSI